MESAQQWHKDEGGPSSRLHALVRPRGEDVRRSQRQDDWFGKRCLGFTRCGTPKPWPYARSVETQFLGRPRPNGLEEAMGQPLANSSRAVPSILLRVRPMLGRFGLYEDLRLAWYLVAKLLTVGLVGRGDGRMQRASSISHPVCDVV